jgi:CheY-like chemotaxis protein
MLTRQRTLLIVEDDEALSQLYQRICRMALHELSNDTDAPLTAQADVLQAYSYDEALAILDNHPDLAFASIDLALTKHERDLNDSDRAMGKEAGGMQFLKRLHETAKGTIAVVVSGETLLSYVTDSLQRYEVMAYFEKTKLDLDVYKTTVKAALLYTQAVDLFEQLETYQALPADMDQAMLRWEQAVAAANQAGLSEKNFPDDLGLRITSLRNRLIDWNTRLPFSQWTHHMLKQRVVGRHGWMLVQIRMTNLPAFYAAHASQVDPLLFFVGNLVQQAASAFDYTDAFVGLLGQRNTALPYFVLVVDEDNASRPQQFREWLQHEFEAHAVHFTSVMSEPYIVPDIDILIWQSQDRWFTDLHELLDALGASRGEYV